MLHGRFFSIIAYFRFKYECYILVSGTHEPERVLLEYIFSG